MTNGMDGSVSLGIRLLDIIFAVTGLVISLPLLLVLLLLGYFDTGSPLFRQERVGQSGRPFTLVKFRTMKPETASLASHLVEPSSVTPLGRFLRKTKLDELPQLWNVLKGEMSLVGPRPCLFNQQELIEARKERGVFDCRPGITGLGQVEGIDMSTPELLAGKDAEMMKELSVCRYFHYIIVTVLGRGSGDRVRSH